MKKIIKQILKEDRQESFLNRVIMLMKDEYPIYKKLDDYGFNLSEEELNYVLSGIFGETVTKYGYQIHNKNFHVLYIEYTDGFWKKFEYDGNGNRIYLEISNGNWEKYEYDENGNITYYERSDGYWEKLEYDENGNKIYVENSDGYWYKKEYNDNGNEIYIEEFTGWWIKKEYDDNGNLTYSENSDGDIEYYR